MVKKIQFSSICLSSTSRNKKVGLIASQVYEILQNKGCDVFHDKSLERYSKTLKSSYRNDRFILDKVDLIIAIGGDGTMLNCSRNYGSKGLPILGINLGKLGFLTDIAPKEVTSDLLNIIEGDFVDDSRFFIETTINQKKNLLALNEVVVHSGVVAQLIEFDLYIDNDFVYRQKADGLIISTPTGSTAYSLSGGGPIVHPSLNVLTILPMFPQSLSTSPLIVDANSTLRIELINSSSKAKLSFDSHNSILVKGKTEIEVNKSKSLLTLIHPKDNNFYESCRTKLGWSSNFVEHKQ